MTIDHRPLFDARRTAYLQEGPPPAEVRRNRLGRLLVAVRAEDPDPFAGEIPVR
ncbi:hypothetical protein [Actinoplanes subglobosus]|uniref:Uncharacterized protein n=1 Tax=Actinoplanes subglobosus TaxID=1547892 RepID=A0ABV8IHX5_9ACTN